MIRPVVIIGSGGHAKVIVACLRLLGVPILGRTDADPMKRHQTLDGVPFLGEDRVINGQDPAAIQLINGIGSTGDAGKRIGAYEQFRERGFQFSRVIHPSAIIAGDAEIGEGAQVMAGAVIQPGCRLGGNVVINTGARIDHDCVIGDHVHVAPGAVLCGEVKVGARSHIGAGAVIIQTIGVGTDSLIAAGAVVRANVRKSARLAGVPARSMAR